MNENLENLQFRSSEEREASNRKAYADMEKTKQVEQGRIVFRNPVAVNERQINEKCEQVVWLQ